MVQNVGFMNGLLSAEEECHRGCISLPSERIHFNKFLESHRWSKIYSLSKVILVIYMHILGH